MTARHRRGTSGEEYDIREVSGADAPAVAYREHGRVVVEVDAELRGQERADAIAAAILLFRRGERALVPVPLIGVMFEAGMRHIREHQRTASALAGAAAAATAGMVTLAATGTLDDRARPPAASMATITRTVAAPAATASWTPTVVTPASSRSRTATPTTIPTRVASSDGVPPYRAEAAGDGEPSRRPAATRAPVPKPARTSRRPPASSTPTTRAPSTRPEGQDAADEPDPPRTQESRPTATRSSDPPPTVDEPSRPTPDPQPQPEPEPERGPLVDLNVGGDDCRLADLDVGVGDLLGADVCL